eukprot:3269744-Prymnesium_polylepis.1
MARLRWRNCQTVQTAMTMPHAHGTGEKRSENSPVTYKMINCSGGGGGGGGGRGEVHGGSGSGRSHASAAAK